MNDFNFPLTELENMIPYEREIYIALLQKSQQKKAQAAKSKSRVT